MPAPRDLYGIVEQLRRIGLVSWSLDELPDDFAAWRRDVRQAARAAGLRITVRRGEGIVYVEHLDHVQSMDEKAAAADLLSATISGREHLSFDDAVKARARQRMRLVKNDPDDR